SARPGWWQAYDKNRPQIQQRMKKLSELRAARPGEAQAAIDAAAAKAGSPVAELFYLPLTGQKNLDGWIALLDREGGIVGFALVPASCVLPAGVPLKKPSEHLQAVTCNAPDRSGAFSFLPATWKLTDPRRLCR